MSIYLPEGTDRAERSRQLADALDGVGYLTDLDLIALMGADVHLCTEEDRVMARADLRAMGYQERAIALWGRRPIFWRFEKVAYAPAERPWPCSRHSG